MHSAAAETNTCINNEGSRHDGGSSRASCLTGRAGSPFHLGLASGSRVRSPHGSDGPLGQRALPGRHVSRSESGVVPPHSKEERLAGTLAPPVFWVLVREWAIGGRRYSGVSAAHRAALRGFLNGA